MRLVQICFRTTGCKTNQADTDHIVECLSDLPVRIVGSEEDADIVVVNACTVTAKADRDGRASVYRALRSSSGPVFLTGCLAARLGCWKGPQPHRVHVMPETFDRTGLVAILRKHILALAGDAEAHGEVAKRRARPFIKVQDGCNKRCAYCIVPYVRGESRSVPLDLIVQKFEAEAERGAGEIVLTGVNLGSWGQDLTPRASLPELLYVLVSLKSGPRIRLSSVEPEYLNDDLLDVMKQSQEICPHLHVPVQSGSQRLLEKMERPFNVDMICSRIMLFANEIQRLTVGLDLICGFPGESDEDFAETLDLVQSLPVTYLHVFPFSPRPGTRAAEMGGKVPAEVIARRCAILREISNRRRLERARTLVGQEVEVIDIKAKADGVEGLTAEYFRALRLVGTEIRKGRYRAFVKDILGPTLSLAVEG